MRNRNLEDQPVGAAEPFWRAPRRLARLTGTLTPTQFALVMWVGLNDGDGEGALVTQDFLAGHFRICKKTVQRSLRELRELKLVEYELAERQRKPFVLRLGPDALVADSAGTPLRTRLRTINTRVMSAVMSAETADTCATATSRNSAPDADATADTSVDSRARGE